MDADEVFLSDSNENTDGGGDDAETSAEYTPSESHSLPGSDSHTLDESDYI